MFQRFFKLRGGGCGQIGNLQFLAFLVVDPPNAAEIMIAIRTNGSVSRPMARSTRVVMNHGLVIKIADVKRAIRPDACLNRTEPHISPRDELRLTYFVGDVADAIRLHDFVMDQINGGLSRKVAVVPIRRPGAAIVDGTSRRGCE